MQYRIEDTFECSAEQYWDVFFDPAYNEALFAHLNIGYECQKLEVQGEGAQKKIYRVNRLAPQREMPAFMQRVLRDSIVYTEHARFDAATNRIEVQTIPNLLPDKVKTEGIYRLESQGSGVLRIWDGLCDCKIPLVGGRIESHIVEEIKQSYVATTEFTRKWLKEKA